MIPKLGCNPFWGVPPACGPLLQLATAHAGQGELPKWIATEYKNQGDGSPSDNAKSTINAARRQRLTEEFAPFLAIYYYLSQFIDCP